MIYLRVRPRVTANVDEALWLKDVAGFIADARCRLNEMRIILPKGAGVWQVDAPQLIMQIMEKHPRETIQVLGDGMGWLHRETKRQKAAPGKRRSIARAAVPAFLFVALMLLLFFTGRDDRSYSNVLPYIASLLLGAMVYFMRFRSVFSRLPKRGRSLIPIASLFHKRTAHAAGSTDPNMTEGHGRRLIRSIEKRGKQ